MSAIISKTLKSQKSHLHQWKPENNGPVLLKVVIHHIHKWPPCNFEKLEMSATEERIE